MNTHGGAPGQPGLLRVLNDRAAFELLLNEGPLTRNEIATRTGLSKPTAAEIIRRLESAELIRSAGTESQSGRRGPNAVVYEAITDQELAVAVDVQYVDVRSTVVDALGRIAAVATHTMSLEEMRSPGADIVEAAVDRAAAVAGIDRDLVTAVAVGVQASVDHATDTLTFSNGLPGWPRERVSATLSDALGIPVTVENDANLASIAERHMGAGNSASSFALLWLAEGLGMALDLDGRLHAGASGAAGEIGYLGVPSEARLTDPNAETLSDLISEVAITALAATHELQAANGSPAEWRQVLQMLPELPAQHPFTVALAERIGFNVLPVLAVADPETVVLHGPTGVAGGVALANAVTAWLRTRTRWSTVVVPPGVAENPVLEGARHILIGTVRTALAARVEHLSTSEIAART